MLLDLNDLSSATNHNGGGIHFGGDGKLYVGVGENANGANSQTLDNLLGKVLRINSDGSIPTDNPFFGTATGENRLIWALGLRNPFTFAFQPGTGRLFINDVGQSTWEEINDGVAGANYGWPNEEGPTSPPDPTYTDPIFFYAHGSSSTTGLRDHGRHVLQPAGRLLPGPVRRALLLLRPLQRLDPPARPGEREHGHRLRHRRERADRPRHRPRRQPLLPRGREPRRPDQLSCRRRRSTGFSPSSGVARPEGDDRRHVPRRRDVGHVQRHARDLLRRLGHEAGRDGAGRRDERDDRGDDGRRTADSSCELHLRAPAAHAVGLRLQPDERAGRGRA